MFGGGYSWYIQMMPDLLGDGAPSPGSDIQMELSLVHFEYTWVEYPTD